MAVVMSAAPLPAQAPFFLPDGTAIKLRLNRNLSSADAKIGETVDFEVLDEIMVNGTVIITRGSTALGTVTEAVPKRSMGRAGKLNVTIDSVRLVSGEKIPLRGVKEMSGGGKSGTMAGAMVATSIVFFPAAPLFLFMKGKDITIPRGHEVTVFTNGDARLDRAKFMPSGPPPAQVASAPPVEGEKALSNEDVVALKQAGFGDDALLARIRASRGRYRLDTEDLLRLKKAGVSDTVIAAMIGAR